MTSADLASSGGRPLASIREGLRQARARGTLVPLALLALGAAASFAWLLALARGQYFYADDWDFLLHRGTIPGVSSGWLTPHNGHWSTLVILLNRALFTVFGLTTYWPWVVASLLVHVGVAVALYVLLRHVGCGPWVGLLAALFVLGSGDAGALTQDATVNLTGSLLLGLLATRVVLGASGTHTLRVTWLLLVLGLMCSALGPVMVGLCGVVALVVRGWRVAVRVVVLPAAVFTLWYVGWGSSSSGSTPDTSVGSPQHQAAMLRFISSGLTDPLSFGATWVGRVLAVGLLVGLVVVLVRPGTTSRALRALAAAGVAVAVLDLALLSASARLGFGEDSAGTGRYGYLTLVLLLPAWALLGARVAGLLGRRGRPRRRWRALLGVAAIALVVGWTWSGLSTATTTAATLRQLTGPVRARVVAIGVVTNLGERVLTPHPADRFDQAFDAGLLVRNELHDQLPTGPVDGQRRLEAEVDYFTSVGRFDPGLLGPVQLSGTGFDPTPSSGCRPYRATAGASLVVPSLRGAELGFSGPATSVTTSLLRGTAGASRTWAVHPGVDYFVATSAQIARLVVTFDQPGRYRICTG